MPNKRPNADVATQWFNDDSLVAQWKRHDGEWIDDDDPNFDADFEYRIKPKPVVVRSRRYLWRTLGRYIEVSLISKPASIPAVEREENFIGWLDKEWQEHEVPE